jgi:hypothetical protein
LVDFKGEAAAGAAAIALKDGADPGGRTAAGFCAVWHAEPTSSRQASTVRTWDFASRIFLYKMRDSPWVLASPTLVKMLTASPVRVNALKELSGLL